MFKSIINYFKYRKFITKNRDYLYSNFNLKIDNIYRLGTIVSIPNQRFQLLRGYRNAELDIHKELEEELRRYLKRFDIYLMQNNLVEFIGLYYANRTGENAVTVIMSYKKINTVKIANTTRTIIAISLLSLFLGFISPIYMIPGASVFILSILSNIALFKKLFV